MDAGVYCQKLQKVVQADHELLSLDIENLRRMFMDDHPSHTPQRFAHLQLLITLRMLSNFENEENEVFSALAANNHSKQATEFIGELLREHEQLLAEAQNLNGLLLHRDVTECKGELWTKMLDFLGDLEKHAVKEDRLFELFTSETSSESVEGVANIGQLRAPAS